MNEEFPMTLIDNRLLDKLLMEAAASNQDSPPTFTPDPNYGEGTPSQEENNYREELLLLLGLLFISVRDIQKGVGTGYQKQSRIQAAIDNWMKDAKTAVDTHLDLNHAAGINAANKMLLDKGINPTGATLRGAYYDVIHQQQLNVESIGRELSDNLRGNLAVMTAEGNYKVSKSAKTRFNLNTYFRRAQTRVDRMATYGSTASYIEGQMSGFYDWQNVLLFDWETAGDKKVCNTCYAYANAGPYTMANFPFIPHPGCRCRMVVSSRVPHDIGMFLPLALATEDLLNQYNQNE